jgi:hypothetical protein
MECRTVQIFGSWRRKCMKKQGKISKGRKENNAI